MATTTPRIGLTKPDGTDLVDIAVLNTNFDKIDSNIASTKIQATKPTTANAGDLWWDSDTGTLYLYYTDANSSQWVAATSDPINIGVVASQAERDAQYPTPAQGMSVYRTDLGVTQRYYGLYNVSTNPGGMDTAGWYNQEKNVGLIPMRPSSVTIATGTGSANAIGQVSFSGATKLSLDGLLFPGTFKAYKFILHVAGSTAADIYFQYRQSGTDITSGNYYFQQMVSSGSSASFGETRGAGVVQIGSMAGTRVDTIWGELLTPNTGGVSANRIFAMQSKFDGGGYTTNRQYTGILDGAFTGITGFTIQPTAGNFSGWVQVFGYNN